MIDTLTKLQVELMEDGLRYKVSELKTEIFETKHDGWKNLSRGKNEANGYN